MPGLLGVSQSVDVYAYVDASASVEAYVCVVPFMAPYQNHIVYIDGCLHACMSVRPSDWVYVCRKACLIG